MVNLSVVVLTKNEEKNLEECLDSVKFCDEFLIIDDDSDDDTVSIARKFGAKVYKRNLESDFAAQRNYALLKARGKWVLFIDADERVPRELANEIVQCVNDPILPFSGFTVNRCDEMWGRKILHGECGTIALLRLVRKGSGVWRRPVHETFNMQNKSDKTYHLKNTLMHYPHQTLAEFITDVDRMSTIHAKANLKEKKRSNVLKIVFYPPLKFIKNYVLKLGFRDGTQGFMIAAVMSFHSYLAWSKLWLMQRNANR